ncbi:hypothetical protein PG990_006898 [Apiospora arundinis]
MDPGNILTIIELSTSALKLGSKVYREFFGPDKSAEKLQRLNVRLQGLNEILQIIAKSGIPLLNAQYIGTDTTLKECKSFLKEYEATLSSRSGFRVAAQRTFFPFNSEGRLDAFDKRINNHWQELSTYMNLQLLEGQRSSAAALHISSSTQADSRNQLAASPEVMPSRRWTGDTLREDTSNSLPSPRAPILDVPLRSLSVASSLDQLAVPLLEDTQPASPRASGVDNNNALSLLTPPLHGMSGSSSYPPSIAEGAEDDQYEEGRPRSEGQPIRPQPSPIANEITVVQNGVQGRPVKFVLGSRCQFDLMSDCYSVEETGQFRIVEWTTARMRLRHFIPRNETRIPYTKPNDKSLEVSFLPRSTRHTIEITDSDGTRTIQEIPRYYFRHKPDRETFQRKVRNRQFLEMVQALVVHSGKEKYIAKDVHLKIWRTNASDDSPILSFAHHEKDQSSHHVEYKIRWFKRTPEFKGENRLILRVYSQESDLEYGPSNEEPPARRPSFGDRIRRRNSGGSRSPSVSGRPAAVLYEQKGEVPPANVQRLGYLDIEFQTSMLRDKFIKACYDVHQPGSILARRNTGVSDGGLPSPQALSRPPSWTHLPGAGGASMSPTSRRNSNNEQYRVLSQFHLTGSPPIQHPEESAWALPRDPSPGSRQLYELP